MNGLVGRRLGRYEIVGLIGSGGMGEVYRARDVQLGRDVAVKVLSAKTSEDPKRLERFEQEAHAVALLSHPNILDIHDFGIDVGVAYAVTELLEEKHLAVMRFEAGGNAPGLQEMADGLTEVVAREPSVLGEGETSTAEAGCGVDCGEHLS